MNRNALYPFGGLVYRPLSRVNQSSAVHLPERFRAVAPSAAANDQLATLSRRD